MPKVYISPSMQGANPCKMGDSEKNHANAVADLVEPYLKASGIEYKRNKTITDRNKMIADSNAYKPDLHFAIHTNGSNGKVRGHHAYYYATSESGKKIAQILCNNIGGIYHVDGAQNYAIGNKEYAELKKTKAIAVIEETVFHDNELDAEWYHANEAAVARYIAKSICDYFDIPLVIPIDYKQLYEAQLEINVELSKSLEHLSHQLDMIMELEQETHRCYQEIFEMKANEKNAEAEESETNK